MSATEPAAAAEVAAGRRDEIASLAQGLKSMVPPRAPYPLPSCRRV